MNSLKNEVLWAATVRTKTFEERIEAAQAGGFTEMSAFPIDVKNWEDQGKSIDELNQLVENAGIKITILDPLTSWVPGWQIPEGMSEGDAAFIDFSIEEFFRMARALKVDKISLIEPFGKPYDPDELQEAFNKVVDVAHNNGMKAQVEFMPFSAISSLKEAWSLVHNSQRENAGLVFDSWHYYRGTIDDALLSKIPGEKIFSVQLADADHSVHDHGIFYDLLHFRKPPLEGDFPMLRLRDYLQNINGLSSVGIELFSDRFDSLSPSEAGKAARESIDLWWQQKEEQETKLLLQKLQELCQATLTQDEKAYERLLGNDFVGISFHGKRVNKSKFSEVHLNPKTVFITFSTTTVQARMLDKNTGWIDGIINIGHSNAEALQINHFSAVLVKMETGWEFFSWQDTPIQ